MSKISEALEDPVIKLLSWIIGFIVVFVTFYNILISTLMVDPALVNAFYLFMIGFIIGRISTYFFSFIGELRIPREIAILHSSRVGGVQKEPVRQAFVNNAEVKFFTFDLAKFKLQNQNMPDWAGAKEYQEKIFRKMAPKVRESTKIHYFGHASVSMTIHLGYLFSQRFKIQIYQHLREDNQTIWGWKKTRKRGWVLEVTSFDNIDSSSSELAILIEQSAQINLHDIEAVVNDIEILKIKVPDPNIHDLRVESQVKEIANAVKNILDIFSSVKLIHLFCAIPAPIAFGIGQNISFIMHPQIQLYNFTQSSQPRYKKSITLN